MTPTHFCDNPFLHHWLLGACSLASYKTVSLPVWPHLLASQGAVSPPHGEARILRNQISSHLPANVLYSFKEASNMRTLAERMVYAHIGRTNCSVRALSDFGAPAQAGRILIGYERCFFFLYQASSLSRKMTAKTSHQAG